jgi:hypothetical protein
MNTSWIVEGSDAFLEFLNQNMHRNYPIQDSCVVKTADNVYLPSSFLVDCQIVIPCESTQQAEAIDLNGFFVSHVMFYTSSVQVIISYQPASGSAFQCACSSAIILAEAQVEGYPTVTLTPAAGIPDGSPLKNLSGTLWIGTTANMAGLGSMHFEKSASQLFSRCIIPNTAASVTGITVLDSDGNVVKVLTGNVTVQMDDSIVVSYNGQSEKLEIGVDDTWLQTQIQQIVGADFHGAIKTINGQSPDDEGNFTISGLDCTDIKNYPNTNGIAVQNTCSKPCCGDESADLVDIKDSQQALQDKMNRVSENLNTFINSINNVETRLPSLVASRK